MSLQRIQQYYTKVENLIQYGGSKNETAIRSAFQNLLEQYCIDKNLILVTELKFGIGAIPDGTLKDALRQDWGYWESKDTFDTLDDEVQRKFQKGYPTTNILFEDSQTAVLFQNGIEVSRAAFSDSNALDKLLTAFVSYEPKEVQTFRAAIEKFKQDLPGLVTQLRNLIEKQAEENHTFADARADFWELCRESINPHIVMADVREMIIQHILTEDIFITIFSNAQFLQENNIANELAKVVNTFFTGAIKQNILIKIDPYIKIIKAAASNISDHHEKQRFLKVVYENFYKAYNPAGADRLGIMYTPNEIVRFMVQATDYLTNKDFGRCLADNDVEILDPATGTGTFITELIEYIPKNLLTYKYETELHCNEVAILPYYIANLNIEYTYAQKMDKYVEFKNICFVDTLENLGFDYENKQYDLLSISAENLERIKLQNQRKISVIIGNPPYNANQLNENENNKNRPYPKVDKRIKETYIKESTAQKTKLYDMYSRFVRWASDRLSPNGVIAFVSNNSFIDARTYDGFRKVIAEEFNEIYIIDMKGYAQTSGERRRREGGNIFSDQIKVGIAVYFLIKKQGTKGCKIYYNCIDDYVKSDAKKAYLRDNRFENLSFIHIKPDKRNKWINQSENEWGELLPLASKEVKFSKNTKNEQALFKLFSVGVVTARDEWVYGRSLKDLTPKVTHLIKVYNSDVKRLKGVNSQNVADKIDYSIKWTRAVKRDLVKGKTYSYQKSQVKESLYRPYTKLKLYFNKDLNEMQNLMPRIFRGKNIAILISGPNSPKPFTCLATNLIPDFNSLSPAADGCRVLPFYDYTSTNEQLDNITDWALKQFHANYADDTINKENIFDYIYAVLHNPLYRQKYEKNLKEEFPRIPFYKDFWKLASYGKQLMDLHLNYDTALPYLLVRTDTKLKTNKSPIAGKAKLKVNMDIGTIELDSITILKGIPPIAWEYKLGNRSALEWVLEHYKEHKPKDQTILANFNTYHFADFKELIIDLLQRVCNISIETMKIIKEMESMS